eukprot:sb/3466304/
MNSFSIDDLLSSCTNVYPLYYPHHQPPPPTATSKLEPTDFPSGSVFTTSSKPTDFPAGSAFDVKSYLSSSTFSPAVAAEELAALLRAEQNQNYPPPSYPAPSQTYPSPSQSYQPEEQSYTSPKQQTYPSPSQEQQTYPSPQQQPQESYTPCPPLTRPSPATSPHHPVDLPPVDLSDLPPVDLPNVDLPPPPTSIHPPPAPLPPLPASLAPYLDRYPHFANKPSLTIRHHPLLRGWTPGALTSIRPTPGASTRPTPGSLSSSTRPPPTKPYQTNHRTSFSPSQIRVLEERYLFCDRIEKNERTELAARIGVSEASIRTWFQNRRAKQKRTERIEQALHLAASTGVF